MCTMLSLAEPCSKQIGGLLPLISSSARPCWQPIYMGEFTAPISGYGLYQLTASPILAELDPESEGLCRLIDAPY